jgi:hypothetical protein
MNKDNWKAMAIFALIFLGVVVLFFFLMIDSMQGRIDTADDALEECILGKEKTHGRDSRFKVR